LEREVAMSVVAKAKAHLLAKEQEHAVRRMAGVISFNDESDI
jgi:hypothetical protein